MVLQQVILKKNMNVKRNEKTAFLIEFFLFFPLAITNPKVPPGTSDSIKRFNFDYSYWSHDVSKMNHPPVLRFKV